MAKKATSGKGHVVSESVLHVVAGVYDELEKMLATESPDENWLREGMGLGSSSNEEGFARVTG